jgi:hypothetical protein
VITSVALDSFEAPKQSTKSQQHQQQQPITKQSFVDLSEDEMIRLAIAASLDADEMRTRTAAAPVTGVVDDNGSATEKVSGGGKLVGR